MDRFISVETVSHTDSGVEPDSASGGEGVIDVDEAAFGCFEVVGGERVGDAAEEEGLGGVEGEGGEGYWGPAGQRLLRYVWWKFGR